MYLFFDTETTGLPRTYHAPAHHVENWPRLVQLAWIVTDASGAEQRQANFIIRPDGFTIPWRSVWVHRITTAKARREGVALGDALDAFVADVDKAEVLIAHNMAFDEKIVGAELLRGGRRDIVALTPRRCTMKWSKQYVGLPGRDGLKFPTLLELHRKLFGRRFRGAHDALADVRACARCYFELRRLGVMP